MPSELLASDAVLYFAAILLSGVAGLLGAGIGIRLWDTQDNRDQEDRVERPSFEDVCEAAARAKTHRQESDDDLNREFVDGADAVLGELMADGFGESPREMMTAYEAGGEDVEVDLEP